MKSISINKKTSSRDICTLLAWWCMFLTPIIDNVVGYFMNTSGEETSISKVFRMFFIFLLFLVMVYTLDRKKVALLIVLFSYVLVLPLLYSFLNNSPESIMTDTIYLLKLLFPAMYIIALQALSEKGYPVGNINLRLLRYFSVIYPVSVVVSVVLDRGYKSYGSIGIRGFFSSGNESSIVLGAMFIVNYAFMKRRTTIFSVVMTMVSAITGILTASKAVIILYALFGIFIITKKQKSKIKNIIVIVTVFVLLALVMDYFFYNEIIAFADRMMFRYKQLGSSFWNVLFSNRNQKILPNFKNNYCDTNGIFYFLFGRGSYYHIYKTKYSTYLAAGGLIEMDFFDLLLQNGIILFGITIVFYFQICRRKVKDEMFSVLKFACLAILLFSFMAGHVLYNPLSSTILALLCSLLVVYRTDSEKQREQTKS